MPEPVFAHVEPALLPTIAAAQEALLSENYVFGKLAETATMNSQN
jgi:hypothetical protein